MKQLLLALTLFILTNTVFADTQLCKLNTTSCVVNMAISPTTQLCEGQPDGCHALFAPLLDGKPVSAIVTVPPPKEPKKAGKYLRKVSSVPARPVSNEGDLSSISFAVPILPDLTPEYINGVKKTKADQLAYLAELEKKYQFPEGTLRVKWFIESMAGKLNIKNKFGFEGHFQIGGYEQKKYGVKDPYNFKQAAHGTVRLSRAYHVLLQGYAKTIIPWNTRSMASFYTIHNQGFMGLGTQYNAIHHKTALLPRVRRNMCNNIPMPYYPLVCAKGNVKHKHISDAQFSEFFHRMWEGEVTRIWTEIQK
jgi:hypothetical protein